MKHIVFSLMIAALTTMSCQAQFEREYKDVPYVDNGTKAQVLDLYLPAEGNGPFPVMVFIHGGAWFGGDKRGHQVAPWLKLVPYGYAVASINYTLAGDAPHPAGIRDCKTAIRFLKANARKYHINPKRMAVSGESSGAHYALMVTTTPGIPEFENLAAGNPGVASDVTCCVSWYGGLDLPLIIADAMNPEWDNFGAQFAIDNCSRYLNHTIESPDDPELELASPIHYITPEMPPVLLQHGTNDQLAPHNQSVRFYEKAVTIVPDGQVELDLLEGFSHADERFGSYENMARVAAWLDKYMK